MRRHFAVTMMMVGLAAVVLAGCGESRYEAAAVNEAVDKCEICNMQVNDDGFATQLITEEGKVYKFDDLGCMNEWKVKNGTAAIAIEFVRDHDTREWVKLDNAYFAYDPSFKSPMAYGLVSFKDKPSAERYIADEGKGTLMSAAELSSHSWVRNQGGMHMKWGTTQHDESAHQETDTKRGHN